MIWCSVETGSGLSHNWFVAASQVGFSTEQRKAETTSSTRIAAGLILGMACFAAVLTGGIFVGQTIGDALSTLQTQLRLTRFAEVLEPIRPQRQPCHRRCDEPQLMWPRLICCEGSRQRWRRQ